MSTADTIEVVVRRLTPDGERVLLVELGAADPGVPLPPFQAGGHVDLRIGAFVRQYSLVGSDDARDRYLIGVLRERARRGGSAAVHDTLRVGDRLRISPPRNTFPVDLGAQHSILLAGGIGITPLISIAERLYRAGASFELHAFTATPATLPLSAHVRSRPWLDRVGMHFSASGDSFRGAAPTVIGRPVDGRAVYLCGPLGFVASAASYTAAAEWRRDAVHVERFQRAEPVETDGDAFTVIAASTGRQLHVAAGQTIAEVLKRGGFEVALSCEQGVCGSCLTGVVAGVPDHRDEVQTPAEHAANTLINVCCSRSRTPVLTLEV